MKLLVLFTSLLVLLGPLRAAQKANYEYHRPAADRALLPHHADWNESHLSLVDL